MTHLNQAQIAIYRGEKNYKVITEAVIDFRDGKIPFQAVKASSQDIWKSSSPDGEWLYDASKADELK